MISEIFDIPPLLDEGVFDKLGSSGAEMFDVDEGIAPDAGKLEDQPTTAAPG